MHSIIQNLGVKIYVVWKLKDTKLKITPTCFGSYVIHHQGVYSCTWLKLFVVVHRFLSCACSVFGSEILNHWCVCVRYDGLGTSSQTVGPYTHTTGSKFRCQTPIKHTTNICEQLRIISVKYSCILPDGGSHTIRNMLEWFLILCLLTFIQRRF